MDKLEHYLDQVCRGIAGPRSLRQHIRQELREHLMDAVSEHENAGVTHEAAIERALEEFGGPEEVRRELEATHGHRLMTVVVDKAMQWKEKTMKAKWLWTTWAHLALGLVIVLQLMFIYAAFIFVVPKFWYFQKAGWLNGRGPNANEAEVFAHSFIGYFEQWLREWQLWAFPTVLIAWLVYEWRFRGENKSFIRLSAMGTLAVTLTILSVLMAYSLIIPMHIAMPVLYHRNFDAETRAWFTQFSAGVDKLEMGAAQKDWGIVHRGLIETNNGIADLNDFGSSAPVLIATQNPQKVSDLRAAMIEVRDALHQVTREAWPAQKSDDPSVQNAIQKSKAFLQLVPRPTSMPSSP